YLPSEVRRVLAPGGCFLTQQVAGDFNREFYALLGEPAPTPEAPHWNLGFARAQLEAAELPPVAGGEGWEVLHFADVGALAWYLLNLPWVFPGFSFRRHRERLRGLHESGEPLAVRQFLFWLEARSPQAARG
ncbi:TPA: class I SAM-dependent methyltransferase, partial [Pseudomonas aeruginosa]